MVRVAVHRRLTRVYGKWDLGMENGIWGWKVGSRDGKWDLEKESRI